MNDLHRIDTSGLRDVACVFPDMNGFPRGKIRPAGDFLAGRELRIAEAVALHTVDGNYPHDDICGHADQDMLLVPDLATLRHLPWASGRAIAIHDALRFDGAPSAFASRSVLRRVLDAYAAHGWQAVVAPEIEFYLFDRNPRLEAGFEAPGGRGGLVECGQSAYALDRADDLAPFWAELADTLPALGVRIDTWLHEVGANQFEINLQHGEPLGCADQVLYFKLALREIAARHGMLAVFMAKPTGDQPGSSMHIHQSVVDASGANLFADDGGEDSALFVAHIGGLQRYLADLMPIFAPNFNSWRRYVKGSQAPVNLEWAQDNRTVALRVPSSGRAARRVENRLAGSDANPYLAIAASLACGLRGMEEQLSRRASIGQRTGYDFPRELPPGMETALARLQASTAAREMLGDAFVTAFCGVKQTEHEGFMSEVGAWERRYLALQA